MLYMREKKLRHCILWGIKEYKYNTEMGLGPLPTQYRMDLSDIE